MYSTQVATADRRLPGSTAILVPAAFAVGILVGLGVQGALDRATSADVVAGTVSTVARHDDMSAAAYAAMHATSPMVVATPTESVPDMSAAAYAAMHPSMPPVRDMSAAAYAAMHPDTPSDR